MKMEIVFLILVLVIVAFVAGYALQQKSNNYTTGQANNLYSGEQGSLGQLPATPRPLSNGGGCG